MTSKIELLMTNNFKISGPISRSTKKFGKSMVKTKKLSESPLCTRREDIKLTSVVMRWTNSLEENSTS